MIKITSKFPIIIVEKMHYTANKYFVTMSSNRIMMQAIVKGRVLFLQD